MGQGFDPRLPGASDEASGAEAFRPTLPDDVMAGENGECATHGCERKVASSRARYCRQCFIVRARLASLRRSSFGGGGGGNRVARGLSGNAGNKITGPTKVSAGSRSGVKRSAKHALVVQKSWLDKILDGEKTWEIRGSPTSHRGWVFFAQSKATGQLFGRARLVDCFELSADTFEAHADRHCVPTWSSVTYKRAFAWVLEQAERFEKPFAYAHRPGAVVWVNVR